MQLRQVCGMEHAGGSSWQSLAGGAGSIEADRLHGEIVLPGRTFRVRTPVDEILRRAFARTGRGPGELPVAELLVEVESASADS